MTSHQNEILWLVITNKSLWPVITKVILFDLSLVGLGFIRLIIICGHYDQSLQISTWSDITKVIITDFYKSHYDRLYKSHFLWSYGQYKSHYDQSLQLSTWPDIAKVIMVSFTKVIMSYFYKNHYDRFYKSHCVLMMGSFQKSLWLEK